MDLTLYLTITTPWTYSADDKLVIFSYYSQKTGFDIHANCLYWRQFALNVKACFIGKIRKTIFQNVVC